MQCAQSSHSATWEHHAVTIMIPGQQKIELVGLVTCLDNVSSCAGHLRHNGFVGAAPSIQQAALPHIGSAHQSHLHRANRMTGAVTEQQPMVRLSQGA